MDSQMEQVHANVNQTGQHEGGEMTDSAPISAIDKRPEAIAQRKRQELANHSPQVQQLKAMQEAANNRPQAQHATQMKSSAPIQRMLPDGLYQTNTSANMRGPRNQKGEYPKADRPLERGTLVRALGRNAPGASRFKAGLFKENEHTWVEAVPDPATEYEYDGLVDNWGGGWVEDSKLGPAQGALQDRWQDGDKLYGRHETRDSVRRLGYGYNAPVRGSRDNIVDDVNNELIYKNPAEQSDHVKEYGRHVSMVTGAEDPSKVRIRKLCKIGLGFYSQNNRIHFMLDGLNAAEIAQEAEDSRRAEAAFDSDLSIDESQDFLEKRCTSAEIRALLRQRMADLGMPGGKNSGINLRNVSFYIHMTEAPAPWDRAAPAEWRALWTRYSRYRAGRGQPEEA